MMNLGKYLENTYDQKMLERFSEAENSDSKLIANLAKIKVMSFGCVVVGLSSIVFLIARILYLERFTYNEGHLAILAMAFLGLYFYLKKTLDLKRGSIIFNGLWLINLPIRVVMTGGLLSPLIVGYLAHSIYVYTINGHRWGRLSLFWSVVSIGFFTFIDPFYNFEGSLLTDHPEMQTFLDIIALVFVTLPILFMFDAKKSMEASIRTQANKAASFVVMRRLNHEIGNSLYKSLGYLQILRTKKDPKLVDQVRAPLQEIREVGEALSKLAREGDLAQFLTEHKNEIRILSRIKNETA